MFKSLLLFFTLMCMPAHASFWILPHSITQNDLAARTGGSTTAGAGNVAFFALNGQASAGSSTSSFSNVTGFSLTITTTGRPVKIEIGGGASGCGGPYVNIAGTSASVDASVFFQLARTGTSSATIPYGQIGIAHNGSVDPSINVSHMSAIDFPAAGTYTYQLQAELGSASSVGTISCVVYTAYEM